jgi:hypothetical protein
MSKNYVFLVRRTVPPEWSVGSPANSTDYRRIGLRDGENGWTRVRWTATHFSSREKAEGEILMLVSRNADLIGRLAIVKLTRHKGMRLNV